MKNLKMKSARVAKDLTQQGLADAIGVSRQTISGSHSPLITLYIAVHILYLLKTLIRQKKHWMQLWLKMIKNQD